MNDNLFLIPANSKKSMLLFGLFNKSDLILFAVGISATLLLLLILPVENLLFALIALGPGLVCSFLVFPIPNYHNILTLIKSVIEFYSTRRTFIWKGWCCRDEEIKK
ncbi:MAG: hypothetical protein NC181_00460 [Clostridium sp.]|nr:hypothetical protein [Clostridium sp.]MCM1443863.1 hypothetical protein [Candidatus Amulumruptor caecigallinarius]